MEHSHARNGAGSRQQRVRSKPAKYLIGTKISGKKNARENYCGQKSLLLRDMAL